MRLVPVMLVALVACDHSTPFADAALLPLGPISTGPIVQLTFNPGEDYWPTWTADGQGILYQYSQPGSADDDRCIGLLPAAGGTLLWSLCDTRDSEADSTNGFAAFALGSEGRLLYLESTSPIGSVGAPKSTVLWLADTAHPFTRQPVATLPMAVGTNTVSWLADAVWTGPSTFMALGQEFTEVGRCPGCQANDTIFANGIVVAGSTATPNALQAIPGTSGAIDFSVAEGGASIVFVTGNSSIVRRVRLAADSLDVVGTIPSGGAISGVSCRASTCVVTTSTGTASTNPSLPVSQLWSIDLTSGTVQQITSTNTVWYTGHLSPTTGDVVMQGGGAPGFQELLGNPSSNLYLLRNILP